MDVHRTSIGQVDWDGTETSLLSEGEMSNGRPVDIHWTGRTRRDSGTSLVSEGGMSNFQSTVTQILLCAYDEVVTMQ